MRRVQLEQPYLFLKAAPWILQTSSFYYLIHHIFESAVMESSCKSPHAKAEPAGDAERRCDDSAWPEAVRLIFHHLCLSQHPSPPVRSLTRRVCLSSAYNVLLGMKKWRMMGNSERHRVTEQLTRTNIPSEMLRDHRGDRRRGWLGGRGSGSRLTAAVLPGRTVSQVVTDSSGLTWQQMVMKGGGGRAL